MLKNRKEGEGEGEEEKINEKVFWFGNYYNFRKRAKRGDSDELKILWYNFSEIKQNSGTR